MTDAVGTVPTARIARDSAAARDRVSRLAPRPARLSVQRATKSQALTVSHQGVTGRVTDSVEPTNPRDIAMLMLADCGWTDQFSCLDQLYIQREQLGPGRDKPDLRRLRHPPVAAGREDGNGRHRLVEQPHDPGKWAKVACCPACSPVAELVEANC